MFVPSHGQRGDTRTSSPFWNKPWELLPKVFCLHLGGFVCLFVFRGFLGGRGRFWGVLFVCFRRLKVVICVRAAQDGGEPLFAQCWAFEMGRRQRVRRGPAGSGQSILSSGMVGPGSATSGTFSHTRYPREEGRKPLWSGHPTQLWAPCWDWWQHHGVPTFLEAKGEALS